MASFFIQCHGHGTQAALQLVEDQARSRVDLSSGIGRGARRQSAALNALQIAEYMIDNGLV